MTMSPKAVGQGKASTESWKSVKCFLYSFRNSSGD